MDKLELLRLQLKYPPEQLLGLLDDLKKIVQEYYNTEPITPSEPVVNPPVDKVDQEDVSPVIFKSFDGYLVGISDTVKYAGQIWLKPSPNFKGKIASIKVADSVYSLELPTYRDSELWYGAPSAGYIEVTMKDGTSMKSSNKLEYSSNASTPNPTVPSNTSSRPANAIALSYHGKSNENRPTLYTFKSSPLLKAGQTVTFKVGDIQETVTVVKRDNGSIGYPKASGGDSQLLIKNSDIASRGISVLIPSDKIGEGVEAWVYIH